MKREQREKLNRLHEKTHRVAAGRLTAIRGGRDLGITIEVVPPPDPFMNQQHNEALVRLQDLDIATVQQSGIDGWNDHSARN